MIRRLTITMKDGAKVWRDFADDSTPTLEEYLEEISAGENWGKDQHEVIDQPEVRDINPPHEVITPATYKTIPSEYTYLIDDVTEEIALQKRAKELEEKGSSFTSDCHGCLEILGGYNDERNLTLPQIMQMASDFANIESCLNRRMPKTAKSLISALVPDGVLVTEELKTLLMFKLKNY